MNYYEDVYLKRVNRFGTDFKSRLQGEREYAFENYMESSIYRIDFSFNQKQHPGTFEPYKQNETKDLHYLLTRRDLDIPAGTILHIKEDEDCCVPWLIYWKEDNKASGYNRYVMLRMTHKITWTDRKGIERTILAYMYGQEDNMLKDELKSRSRSSILYNENLKLSFFITPANENIRKEDYFVIHTIINSGEGDYDFQEGFRVTGYDLISTKGVEYVSADPMYLKDLTPAPEQQPGEDDDSYFWIKSGE